MTFGQSDPLERADVAAAEDGPTPLNTYLRVQELMIMTILFCRHYQFRLQPGYIVEPDPLITLRPKHGMRLTIRRRGGAS